MLLSKMGFPEGSRKRSGKIFHHPALPFEREPYIQGLSERAKKAQKPVGVTTTFKPANSLRDKLVHVKDRTAKKKRSSVVYSIKCAHPSCNETYIGETKQAPWPTILATHQTCVLRGPERRSLHPCQNNSASNLP